MEESCAGGMEKPLDKARRELKQWQSILAMPVGNTSLEDLHLLEKRWLDPLREKIQELE